MVRMGRRFDSGGGLHPNQQLRPGTLPGLSHRQGALSDRRAISVP
jgi:hypothetical protein